MGLLQILTVKSAWWSKRSTLTIINIKPLTININRATYPTWAYQICHLNEVSAVSKFTLTNLVIKKKSLQHGKEHHNFQNKNQQLQSRESTEKFVLRPTSEESPVTASIPESESGTVHFPRNESEINSSINYVGNSGLIPADFRKKPGARQIRLAERARAHFRGDR